jgi:hypothetical protein
MTQVPTQSFHFLFGEQKFVRRLVHEDGEAGVHRTHEDEAEEIAPPRVEPDGTADDEHHLEPHRRHGEDVSAVVDVPEGGTELGDGHPVRQQPLGGKYVGACRTVRHHGGGHAHILLFYVK